MTSLRLAELLTRLLGQRSNRPEAIAGRTEAGQLTGRVHRRSVLWWGGDDATSDLAKLEWVIEAPEGGELGIEARHQRAGTIRQVVSLDANA